MGVPVVANGYPFIRLSIYVPKRMQHQRRTQAQRRAHTRAQLLGAAATVFAERGFTGASLDHISERAGLTKGALYHHFGSKEGLFLELLDEKYAARLDQARQAPPAARPSDTFSFDRQFALLFLEFVCVAARDPTVLQRLAARLLALRAQTSEALEDDQLATLIGTIANGVSIEALIFGPAAGAATFDAAVQRLGLLS